MKIVYNSLIPVEGFLAINLFGVLFVRKELADKLKEVDINHESIHTKQQIEMLFVFFYVWYVIEWIIKLLIYRNARIAYRNISFEREAYNNEMYMLYTYDRNPFSWIKYIF